MGILDLNPFTRVKSGNGSASRFSTGLPRTIGSRFFPSTMSAITSSASPTTTCRAWRSASSGIRLAWTPPMITFSRGKLSAIS